MSTKRFLAIFTVSIFLIGTLTTTKAFAKGWKKILVNHEKRLKVVEEEVIYLDSRTTTLEDENANQNSRLDSLDSQVADHEARVTMLEGLSFGAALGVYDGSGFLGYFIQKGNDYYVVFEPNAGGLFRLEMSYPYQITVEYIADLLFTAENGCEGQAYGDSASAKQEIYGDANGNFYVMDFTVQPVPVSQLTWRLDLATGVCSPFTSSGGEYRFAIKNIDFPLANTPIEYPIIIRPIE